MFNAPAPAEQSKATTVAHRQWLESKLNLLSNQERAWLKQGLDAQQTTLPEFWQNLLAFYGDKAQAWQSIELALAQDENQVLFLRFTIVGVQLDMEALAK